MDNPSQEPSNAPLDMNTAVDAFKGLFEPVRDESPEALEAQALEKAAADEAEVKPDAQDTDAGPTDEKVTIEVDGKTVELSKAELAESYKNGLRQADYTKKTMEAAEVRKSAEAEITRARQERDAYAQGLQRNAMQLEAVLEQSKQIDWDALISADPVEALKQKHLLEKRQAAFQETVQQLQAIDAQTKAEQLQQAQSSFAEQQEKLLAKLPEWKDPVKAKAEAESLKTFLKDQGFEDSEVNAIRDHRAVLLARDAMRYRQLVSKAQAAAKKVEALPQKVVRPGVTDSNKVDGRTAAMQRLNRSGSVSDAADAFKALL